MTLAKPVVWNVGIILACSVLMGALIVRKIESIPRAVAPPEPGERIKGSSALAFQSSRKTILLLTASTCHFCSESMPFYRRVSSAVRPHGTRMIGLSWEPVERNAAYLSSHGVEVDGVISAAQTSLTVHATPTLLLVDHEGRVLKVWSGRLDEA